MARFGVFDVFSGGFGWFCKKVAGSGWFRLVQLFSVHLYFNCSYFYFLCSNKNCMTFYKQSLNHSEGHLAQ